MMNGDDPQCPMELISSPVATPGGAPGEGLFTVADRQRLGPVMLKTLQRTDWGPGSFMCFAHFDTGVVFHT